MEIAYDKLFMNLQIILCASKKIKLLNNECAIFCFIKIKINIISALEHFYILEKSIISE
jgi:hypothetical protein